MQGSPPDIESFAESASLARMIVGNGVSAAHASLVDRGEADGARPTRESLPEAGSGTT